MVKKFSQFASQTGPARVGAVMVGLWSGVNTQFDFPGEGVGDSTGQFILKWLSGGVGATNYVCVTSGLSGDPALISAEGSDADVDLLIQPQADGSITLNPTQNGDINLSLGGAGDINLDTNAGKVVINSTTGIDAVLDQDDMSSNSATAVPTQQSTKAYVDAATGLLSDLTFVTNTDESASLPNSVRLLGTANQIDATDGALSLPTDLITPGGATFTGNLHFLLDLDNYESVINAAPESYLVLRGPAGIALITPFNVNLVAGEGITFSCTTHHDFQLWGTSADFIIKSRPNFPAGPIIDVFKVDSNGLRLLQSGATVNNISSSSTTALATDLMTAEAIQSSITAKSIQRFQVTVNQAALAAGASVTLFSGAVSKQYKILNLWTSVGGTNFSGIGGDRNISITDNTTTYSVIPSASLLAIVANQAWGIGAALPFPTVAIDTSTASGADIVAKYSGGTTDYTAGSIVISGIVLLT